MKLDRLVVNNNQNYEYLDFGESFDLEDNITPMILITSGYGADHTHSFLNIEDSKKVITFLEKFVTKNELQND